MRLHWFFSKMGIIITSYHFIYPTNIYRAATVIGTVLGASNNFTVKQIKYLSLQSLHFYYGRQIKSIAKSKLYDALCKFFRGKKWSRNRASV